MTFIGDFLAGRTHKLARDFLFSGVVIICMSVGAMMLISRLLDDMRVASRQSLPPKVAAASTTTQTLVRSVLDDNVTTASIGGRSIIIDPCTGQEKK